MKTRRARNLKGFKAGNEVAAKAIAQLLAAAAKAGAEGDHTTAEKLWREYLATDPDHPAVNFNVGWCIEQRANCPQDRLKAAEYYERVLTSPKADMTLKANAMNQIGLMCLTIGDNEKAAISFGFALKIQPDHGAAKINLADAHRALGQYELADSEYAGILSQDPDNPEARMCSGMLALLLGDYARGWDLYRARWQVKTFTTKPFIPKPASSTIWGAGSDPLMASEILTVTEKKWEGEPLDGKTLLLSEEQGFGDTFQFIRYAAEFKLMGARVIFRCQPCLRDVMAGVYGLDGTTDGGDPFDYWLPLLDAPHALGTTLETIPPAHCIRIMPDWRRRSMQGNLLRRRIGLVWAGSPTHGKDKGRSIAPELFQPIIDAHPECDFYSLQAGPRHPEVERLRGLTDLAPQIESWTDTAQLLSCIDLLISVDTACVHLAGAVGTPAWILVPHSPDFRWLLGREDSPWYPKARLFRQPTDGDWQTPINRIIKDL